MSRDKDMEIFNLLFDAPLNWDKRSYKFNREEKDMNPYSINVTEKGTVIVHNILGIDKKDLKLLRKSENGNVFIIIEGKTKDEFTGKIYSINSKFVVDDSCLDVDNISSTMKNGLLYITIPNKTKVEKEDNEEIIINIQ